MKIVRDKLTNIIKTSFNTIQRTINFLSIKPYKLTVAITAY